MEQKCAEIPPLYCFFWATLHMLAYIALNLGWNFSLFAEEIVKRPYLTLGIASWLILLILTITSNLYAQRKLGKHWQSIHNWVYLVLILAPIHYYWSVKSEIITPSIYIAVALLLLGLRWKKFKRWLPKKA